jgi:hypothetical protein
LAGPQARLQVRVRFLHLLARQVGELVQPVAERSADSEPPFRAVEALKVGDKLYQTWQEAVERTVALEEIALAELLAKRREQSFSFPAQRTLESLRSAQGEIAGLIIREQECLAGSVELSADAVEQGLFKVRVRIVNRTPLVNAGQCSRDDALMRTLVSTHILLSITGGEFVSAIDPPQAWRTLAAACHQEGAWPVLVGEDGAKDTMLGSPIILYDYPRIAPESPGDFFDATEIDEMLTLRILTMTDEEKQIMAGVDERTRALLKRTEALYGQFLGLHGTLRDVQPVQAENGHD